jgi:hypothetical protein
MAKSLGTHAGIGAGLCRSPCPTEWRISIVLLATCLAAVGASRVPFPFHFVFSLFQLSLPLLQYLPIPDFILFPSVHLSTHLQTKLLPIGTTFLPRPGRINLAWCPLQRPNLKVLQRPQPQSNQTDIRMPCRISMRALMPGCKSWELFSYTQQHGEFVRPCRIQCVRLLTGEGVS